MGQELTVDQRNALQRDGQIVMGSAYDEAGYVLTRHFLDDGEKHLLLDATIDIGCPIILMHGMQDAEVPWQTGIRLANALASKDVRLTLVKSGDHRLSSDRELAHLGESLLTLLNKLGALT
jgi:pimeloyl-ACP methyl ester carboxylesterase